MEQDPRKLKEAVYEIHRFSEGVQRAFQESIRLILHYTEMFKTNLGVAGMEFGEKTLEGAVSVCKGLGRFKESFLVEAVKFCKFYKTYEMIEMIEMMRKRKAVAKLAEAFKEVTRQTDIIKLLETSVGKLENTIKKFEEVFPEIGDILERLDKPASLLELSLKRVQGLGFIQQGTSMELLPITLKSQVEHWPATREATIREKIDFLVQAFERIEVIVSRG